VRGGHRGNFQRGDRRAGFFTAEALEILQKKKNLRLLKILKCPTAAQPWDVRSVGADSFLLQQRDLKATARRFENRDEAAADGGGIEGDAVRLARGEAREIKRDLLCGEGPDARHGAGQMSRVDSSRIAVWKAGEAKLSLAGSVVCSDAFFPFPDGLIAAAEAGATAAIQPGGSVKDAEVIAAADARGMAMAFTGTRHFRH
jgi:phosphoribosylaminoimidazolecarboxamide formyltransferase / IMP cyclohydrolase